MKTRNIIIITLSVILGVTLLVSACNGIGPVVIGSSQMETGEFDMKDFNKVDVGGYCKLDVSQSDSYSVTITANQNLFDYLTVINDNGTLKINLKPFHTFNFVKMDVRITMPALNGLQLSGASRGEVTGFVSTNDLNVDISGASKMNLNDIEAGDTSFEISGASTLTGNIKVTEIDFNISGASTVELKGSANMVDVQASGASTVRLADFPTGRAKFNLSGASNGTTDVSDKLDIILSGASRLVYSGNPNLGSISISGASTLNHQQ
jgi:hypothetical protein